MGKLVDFFRGEKRESTLVGDKHHWIVRRLEQLLGSSAGVTVTPEVALAQSAVFACVRVISETIGSLPLKIYKKRSDGGKEEAKDHPLYPTICVSPNYWQTKQEFYEMVGGHSSLRGNFYAFKEYTRGGKLNSLVPLDPDNVELSVEGDTRRPTLKYKYHPGGNEKEITLPAKEVWHVRGVSSDGYLGLSPITVARNAIGLAVGAEEHGSKYFKNGARTSGVATYPGRLREESKKNLRESLQGAMTGDNAHKMILLEEGLDYKSIGMSQVDSQYLETRQFQVEEIARIFRVPSVLIGHPDKTMTYASVEQLMISFVVHTMRPWLTRIEQSINKNLLTGDSDHFAEFTVEGLLRGDTASRYEAYASALQNKWMTRNEVRLKENMNPVDGGDEFENPAITVDAEQEEDNGKTSISDKQSGD